jgi:glycosyltransferase involved in cell wall biosynthesis
VNGLRLLHLNTERGWRGGEVQTILLAKGLRERGHQCLLGVPAGSSLDRRCRAADLPVESLDPRGEFDLRAILRVAGMARRFGPDLVHYHTSHAVTLGSLASYRAGLRPAVASRRVSFPLSRNPLARFKYTHRVSRVIAVSEGIRRMVQETGIPADKVILIPSAVDLERFRDLRSREACRRELGVGENDFLVGAVGHLAAHKGHEVLIAAAGRLRHEGRGFRFLIVGSGEREAALRRQIEATGVGEIFRLLGFREEVAEILPALDLLAFPSLSGEGSPAALKEAMACGIPVVASDISGVREVVRSGEEGWLLPPGDPESLSAAILQFASQPGLALECGRRGRLRCREFGVERMVERTESVYREILREWVS